MTTPKGDDIPTGGMTIPRERRIWQRKKTGRLRSEGGKLAGTFAFVAKWRKMAEFVAICRSLSREAVL